MSDTIVETYKGVNIKIVCYGVHTLYYALGNPYISVRGAKIAISKRKGGILERVNKYAWYNIF